MKMDIFYFIGGIRMKKRIFAVVMAAVVAFAMFGCGSKTDDKEVERLQDNSRSERTRPCQ